MKTILSLVTICLLFSCKGDSEKNKEIKQKAEKSIVGSWDIFEEGYDLEGSTTYYGDGTALHKVGKSGNPKLINYSIKGDGSLLCLKDDDAPAKYREQCMTIEWVDDNSIRCEIDLGSRTEWYIMRRK